MIESFSFCDNKSKWRLSKMQLSDINLLVGVSGVGKSKTLQFLKRVAGAATGVKNNYIISESEWKLTVRINNESYLWEASTGVANQANSEVDRHAIMDMFPSFGSRNSFAPFTFERISTQDGRILAVRNENEIEFAENRAPKLKNTESLISLFREEETVQPLYSALSRVLVSSLERFHWSFSDENVTRKIREEITNISILRSSINIPLLSRFDILKQIEPDTYEDVIESFKEIFPSVKNVQVGLPDELGISNTPEFQDSQYLTLVIEESNIDTLIPLTELSSGMSRTLHHLVELALAPDHSTILIDEYENGLGVNCLPSVTKHLLERRREIQIIATSHHPYVINNISPKHWLVVTRDGGDVKVQNAALIPELDTKSKHEAFTILLNSSVYNNSN